MLIEHYLVRKIGTSADHRNILHVMLGTAGVKSRIPLILSVIEARPLLLTERDKQYFLPLFSIWRELMMLTEGTKEEAMFVQVAHGLLKDILNILDKHRTTGPHLDQILLIMMLLLYVLCFLYGSVTFTNGFVDTLTAGHHKIHNEKGFLTHEEIVEMNSKLHENVKELDAATFDTEVLQSSHAWLVRFYSAGCAHCGEFLTMWERITKHHGEDLHLGQINIDNPAGVDLAERVGALRSGIPNLLLFSHHDQVTGVSLMKEFGRHQDLVQKIPQHISRLKRDDTGKHKKRSKKDDEYERQAMMAANEGHQGREF